MPSLLPAAVLGLSAEDWVALGTIALALVGAMALFANVLIVRAARDQGRATRDAADATLEEAQQVARQVDVSNQQLKLAESQLEAVSEQTRLAKRAYQLQSLPRLIPGGMETCRVGPAEPILRPPQEQTVVPVFLGVVNAGNGAAILMPDEAFAACGPDGGRGPMGVIVPPALAAGAQGVVKLTPQMGGAQEIHVGMIYAVTLTYWADEVPEMTWKLAFTAQYFSPTHWLIEVKEN
jgi:hypothetical protein